MADDLYVQVPLIYTTKGNVPADSVRIEHGFNDNTETLVSFKLEEDGKVSPIFDKSGTFTVWLKYYDKESGELVREDSHVCSMKGLDLASAQGGLD